MVDINRRAFIRLSVAAGGGAALRPGGGFAPAAGGDVGGGRAVIWSRADRASRMFVEYATTERFENARRVPGPSALETSDFTARLVLHDLPAGQRIFYRVLFQD